MADSFIDANPSAKPGPRFDRWGPSHENPVTGEDVRTPHVHDPATPGGVRPATPQEIPGSATKPGNSILAYGDWMA